MRECNLCNSASMLLKKKIGYALLPVLEKIAPYLESAANWLSDFIDNNSGLSTALISVIGGVGALAVVTAPVITAVASLGAAIAYMGYVSKKARGNILMDSLGGGAGGAGTAGKKGGLLRKAGRALGGKAGLIGAGIGALSIGATLADDGMTGKEKAADVTNSMSSIGGALGGAKLGAALGTVLLPGIGTAVGGVLGSIAGGIGGSWLGETIGDWINPEEGEKTATKTPAAAAAVTAALVATPAVAMPAPVTQQQTTIERIQIHQQPGEDADALAEKVMEKINDQHRYTQQGAQHDE